MPPFCCIRNPKHLVFIFTQNSYLNNCDLYIRQNTLSQNSLETQKLTIYSHIKQLANKCDLHRQQNMLSHNSVRCFTKYLQNVPYYPNNTCSNLELTLYQTYSLKDLNNECLSLFVRSFIFMYARCFNIIEYILNNYSMYKEITQARSWTQNQITFAYIQYGFQRNATICH